MTAPASPRRPKLFVALAILLALLAWLFGPTTLHRLEVLSAQRDCLAYTAPPSQIVLSGTAGRPPTPASLPPCYVAYHSAMHPTRHTSYREPAALFPLDPEIPLFLHERVSSAGVRRLVLILMVRENVPHSYNDQVVFGYQPFLIDPGTFFTPPHDVNWRTPTTLGQEYDVPASTPYTFYAGQPDPADPSRFHLAFDIGPTRYYVHFQLTPDGNALLHSSRTLSPTPPATLP